MGKQRANPAMERAERQIRELLEEIDAQAEKQQGKWADKRDNRRRVFQAFCQIRHLSPDGASVLTTPGITRDLSIGGLSFVSQEHFLRRSPLVVMVTVSGGRARQLTGSVVYSRRVEDNWHLTGMSFGSLDDARLVASSSRGGPAQESPTDSTQ